MAKKRIPFFSEQTANDLVRLLGKKPPPNIGPGEYVNAPEERPVFRNDSAETVPAYGCMRVTGAAEVDNRWVTLIAKPNGDCQAFLFNGPNEVPAGELGTAQGTKVVRCYYTSGTVTAGDTWGPESGWNVVVDGSPAVLACGTVESNAVMMGIQTFKYELCAESSSSFCNQIPGVDLDALETVSAELVDFVLAIKDGCLVKVSVSDCAGSGSV